jgi:transcriptional regulator with XRE-family HTH domain
MAALRKLGADLGLARKRRKQSLRAWAARLEVSVPTLMKMEKGDAAVSIGVYATALWMVGRHEALSALADPKEDVAALESEVKLANRRHRRTV